jgi:uncharacterized protein (DUF433 family)
MSEVTKDADVLGGVPVFKGTRVPVKTLFDMLAAGESLRDFLADFPTVTAEQARTVLADSEVLLEAAA